MTFRSERYRRAVASLACSDCGLEGSSQAAHVNRGFGKGAGIKATDAAIFPLCADRPGIVGCHTRYDQRKMFRDSRDETDTTQKWLIATYMQLLEMGELVTRK